MDRLRAETTPGRKLHWLKPGDLAATARAWLIEQEASQAGKQRRKPRRQGIKR
jgi:hypothetical protein